MNIFVKEMFDVPYTIELFYQEMNINFLRLLIFWVLIMV